MATEKQVGYVLHLLAEAGYRTDWMDKTFKDLGAKCAERSGSVAGWVRGLSVSRLNTLISTLK